MSELEELKRRRLEAQDLETGLIETVYSPFISNVPDDFKIEAAVLDYLINQGVPPTFVPVEYEMPISQLYNSVPKNHPKVSKDFQAGILTALNLVSTQLASFVKTLSPDAKNATAITESPIIGEAPNPISTAGMAATIGPKIGIMSKSPDNIASGRA